MTGIDWHLTQDDYKNIFQIVQQNASYAGGTAGGEEEGAQQYSEFTEYSEYSDGSEQVGGGGVGHGRYRELSHAPPLPHLQRRLPARCSDRCGDACGALPQRSVTPVL